MYTVQTFKEEVQRHGGYEKLMAMYFNNSNVYTFGTDEVFSEDINLHEPTGTVIFYGRDVTGKKYITTRKLEYLEGMTFAGPDHHKDTIDLRAVRY